METSFHGLIKDARKRLGFSTAKDFHKSKKQFISMSYESYANIEAGKYPPPPEKLGGLIEALEIEDLKAFVYSYCTTLMPNDLLKGLFNADHSRSQSLVLKNGVYTDYKEKFHELLQFNRLQSLNELNQKQVEYLETDLVAWDIINLYISADDAGLSMEEIAEKTDSGLESTRKRVQTLIDVGMLKLLENGKYLVTQDVFIIPRKPLADKLTHQLVKRELERCYEDKRNRPYTRFRFMSIDPQDRENIEMFIDNFILDSRRFRKDGGKTHYLQILFSDRKDLE